MKTLSYIFIVLFSMVALSAIPSQGEQSNLRVEVQETVDSAEVGLDEKRELDTQLKVFKSLPRSVQLDSPSVIRTKGLVVKATENLEKCREIESLLEDMTNERQHTARTSR